MGSAIQSMIPALLAIALGFAILLIGMILAPLLFAQQTALLATGSSGDPNLTGSDRTVAGNIGTFFLLIILMTGVTLMIIPIIAIARSFGSLGGWVENLYPQFTANKYTSFVVARVSYSLIHI